MVPLGAERIYLGTWDSVLQYLTASITLTASTNCEIIAYQSIDKLNQIPTVYEVASGHTFNMNLPIRYPYIYFTVRNTTANTQTQFNFEVIYRSVPVANDVNSNVNINDSNGNPIQSTGGLLQVQDVATENTLTAIANGLSQEGGLPVSIVDTVVSNHGLNVALFDSTGVPFTQSHTVGALDINIASVSAGALSIQDSFGDLIGSVAECIKSATFDGSGNAITSTSSALDVNIKSSDVLLALDASVQTLISQNLNNGGTIWLGDVVNDGDISSNTINLSSKAPVTYSYFGNIVCDGGDTPTITILYSADNTTFYATQNSISTSAGGGDFSLDSVSGAHYVKAKVTGITTAPATITMYLNCATP